MKLEKENLCKYINSLRPNLKEDIKILKNKALENDIPIIKNSAEDFLKLIFRLSNFYNKKVNILEVGAAVCYSTIFMADILQNSTITTIERDEKRIKLAKENLKKFNYDISLIEGDAFEEIEKLVEDNKKYDLIFLDSAKSTYNRLLPNLLKLMDKDSILLADNVLHDSYIIKSKYAINRRNITINQEMRKFLYNITHSDYLESYIFDISDGMSISIKKK